MASESLRYIDPGKLRLFREGGSIHLRAEVKDELCLTSVILRRVFPLSSQDEYISVQDGAGKELGLIKKLVELDGESRKLAEEDLDRRYFTPKILSVTNLRQDGGMWTFNVQTQRGASEFYVRNWRDNTHELSPGRWQINSVDGQRFEIPNFEGLDTHSKALLEQLF